MKIFELIDDVEEFQKEHEKRDYTDENFVEYFMLNGNVMICRSYFDTSDGMSFYFGPSVGGEGVSDTLSMDSFLEDICKSLGFKDVLVGSAENSHGINIKDRDKCIEIFDQLVIKCREELGVKGIGLIECDPDE